jgi:hypothetical protein
LYAAWDIDAICALSVITPSFHGCSFPPDGDNLPASSISDRMLSDIDFSEKLRTLHRFRNKSKTIMKPYFYPESHY